ncbi:MAG: nucleotide sugar dehydrogenase, partial [Pseudomonadota bacterium]
MTERLAVLGLGYVGLPVAVALARAYPHTVGFDIAERRVRELREGFDQTGEISSEELAAAGLTYTSDANDLAGTDVFIVTVPTPIDQHRRPDLQPLQQACRTIAGALRPGCIVVFESTVYPGVTEEVCGPMLGSLSGLEPSVDFGL